ncbi:hypothetical protein RB7460 [Rhodopirellula baltica SH 1]|uniref:Uncharacterized protein n=1 Tax=Rhodopirellula baltica (strain DSM 10527 / NCIMB 13988 / SH1) TaxID=243090 RepID=Q7UNP3_RHOBA|nr:hypothetical protein RB7460 [Rhodopirellula baltica SH 1]
MAGSCKQCFSNVVFHARFGNHIPEIFAEFLWVSFPPLILRMNQSSRLNAIYTRVGAVRPWSFAEKEFCEILRSGARLMSVSRLLSLHRSWENRFSGTTEQKLSFIGLIDSPHC